MRAWLKIITVVLWESAIGLLWLLLSPLRAIKRRRNAKDIGNLVEEEVATEYTEHLRALATNFVSAVLEGGYEAAQKMFAQEIQNDYPFEELRRDFERMTGQYDEEPPFDFELMETMENYRYKKVGDVGFAYTAITKGEMSEAVQIHAVLSQSGNLEINKITWGRP